jgi:hypothetical protein
LQFDRGRHRSEREAELSEGHGLSLSPIVTENLVMPSMPLMIDRFRQSRRNHDTNGDWIHPARNRLVSSIAQLCLLDCGVGTLFFSDGYTGLNGNTT